MERVKHTTCSINQYNRLKTTLVVISGVMVKIVDKKRLFSPKNVINVLASFE